MMHGYCVGVSCRNAWATALEGLAQGPYVAARVGFEPPTFRTQSTDPTTEPSPHLRNLMYVDAFCRGYVDSEKGRLGRLVVYCAHVHHHSPTDNPFHHLRHLPKSRSNVSRQVFMISSLIAFPPSKSAKTLLL